MLTPFKILNSSHDYYNSIGECNSVMFQDTTLMFLFKFFVNTEGTRSIPRSFVDLYGIEQEVAIETSI